MPDPLCDINQRLLDPGSAQANARSLCYSVVDMGSTARVIAETLTDSNNWSETDERLARIISSLDNMPIWTQVDSIKRLGTSLCSIVCPPVCQSCRAIMANLHIFFRPQKHLGPWPSFQKVAQVCGSVHLLCVESAGHIAVLLPLWTAWGWRCLGLPCSVCEFKFGSNLIPVISTSLRC